MTPQEKQLIVDALRVYCQRYPSQNKAANSLKNVSPATVSNMLSGKHELIADDMWRHVGAQVGHKANNKDWQIIHTSVFDELYKLFQDAQNDSGVSAITGEAGSGKSETSKQYVAENKRAYRLECSEYWNRKTFMLELLEAMGCDPSGLTVNGMVHEVVKKLKSQDNPLVILDEADKLSDQVLYFFITFYNKLEDHCGIILLSTDYMTKRLTNGLKNKKKGYAEILSRIGGKCIPLDGNTYEDIANMCQVNGVSDTKVIEKIINDSNIDLRRVKKLTRADIKKRNNGSK